METVKSLREKGYKVEVTHFRYYTTALGLTGPYARHEIISYMITEDLYEKGGFTQVRVTDPDDNEMIGEAICSRKDAYNKKLGVAIALGRVLCEFSGEAQRRRERDEKVGVLV